MNRDTLRRVVLATLCLALSTPVLAQPLTPVFTAGDAGYRCFRIPAIVATNHGTLLAFAEGRKLGCSDTGDIDLVLKRSSDGGRTWSPLQVIWDSGENTSGNPAPVVERRSGRILLLSTFNLGTDREPAIIDGTSQDTRRVFVLSSGDDGVTWSAAREITAQVKKPEWTWYATGPVNGIQMEAGPQKGRLVVPCDHIEAGTKKYFSHTIHSDDGGETWQLGGRTPTDQVNESTVAELPGGRLLLNMRNYTTVRVRQTSTSTDGGATWTAPKGDDTLIEPVCQASLVRVVRDGDPPLLAFSNPASQTSRTNMTVRLSRDEGRTWPQSIVLHAGPAAYSNLVVPCDHIEAGTKKYFSHTIHSDDGGETWQLGGRTPTDQVNESTVAELPGGRLLLNMRNYTTVRVRQTSTSTDGGATWSAPKGDDTLIEPVCQASLVRVVRDGGPPLLAFSNPASQTSRTNMTVRLSRDEGRTWPQSAVLHPGPAAYSNLVVLPNGNLACLFEAGEKNAYEAIVFREIGFGEFKRPD